MIGGGNLAGGNTNLTNPGIDMACGMFNDRIGAAFPRHYPAIDGIVGSYNVINPDHAAPTICSPISSGPCH